jgi:hypothetical protein
MEVWNDGRRNWMVRKNLMAADVLMARLPKLLMLLLCVGAIVLSGCGPTIYGAVSLFLNQEEDEVLPATTEVNSPPGASIVPLSGIQSGDVAITYRLFDGDSDNLDIAVEYSPDGGGSFYTATESANPLSEGITDLSALPGGSTHVFVWASAVNMGGMVSQQVQVRITPYDSEQGTFATTQTFTVDNNLPPVVNITTPSATQVGNISIGYILTDTESDSIDILVEYSTDGWVSNDTATKASGGDPITGLTSSATGVAHTFIWDTLTDLGYSLNTTVQVRMTPSDTEAGASDTTTDFTVDNNEAPIASVVTPTLEQSGNVIISYTLYDSNSDPVDVEVKYSTDGGGTWSVADATEVPGPPSEGTSGLTSSPGGTVHVFVWDSLADIGQIYSSQVRLKITPSDFISGSPGETDDFAVSNNDAPSAFVLTPSGVQSGDVAISYMLVEPEDENCSIAVYFSEDSGATWSPATMGSGGDGTTNLVGSPGGTNHTYVWDSAADIAVPDAHQSDIRMKIAPYDPYRAGQAGQTGDFEVDNTTPPWVTLTDPGSPKSANVAIEYTLYDADSETCSAVVEFTTGSGWFACTQSGGDPTSGLTSSPGGTPHTFIWDTISDNVGMAGLENVDFRISPSDTKPGTSDTVSFSVNNAGDAPWVEVTTPAGEQAGNVDIDYVLHDPTSDPCDSYVQFSTDSGATWTDATDSPATGLSSSPGGDAHTFVWNSLADADQIYSTTVKIRVKPHDGANWGDWISTEAFTLDNNAIPSVLVVTPVGKQVGNVTVDYTMFDSENDLCSIYVEYSEDGGSNYSPATQGPGSDGLSGLTSSPGGTPHIYRWDSAADIGSTWQTDIRIRITPSDPYRSGTGDYTGTFEVDNSTVTVWEGTADTNWFDAANWSAGEPDSTKEVGIYAGKPRYPEINADAAAKTLTLGDGASLTILSNKILTVSGDAAVGGTIFMNSGPGTYGSLEVGADLAVSSTGAITADGFGDLAESGTSPGSSGGTSAAGGGGGHGGYGGSAEGTIPLVPGGIPYGTYQKPVTTGSGGGSGGTGGNGAGGAGGGAIRIIVTGTFALDGVISANGADGEDVANGGGGGAGGSIWATCGTLVGSGHFEVSGGNGGGTVSVGGGGAGGRIAVHCADRSGFTGHTNSVADPGSGYAPGRATYGFGSVVFIDSVTNDMVIYNDSLSIVNIAQHDVTVTNGATLVLDSFAPGLKQIKVQATGTFTIEAGCALTGNFLGQLNGLGDGPGLSAGDASQGAGGAGYGGVGGDGNNNTGSGGVTYDAADSPDKLGSGGGDGWDTGTEDIRGGCGGACIKIESCLVFTINGTVSANGQDGRGSGAGGGSGGSILIKVVQLDGNGLVSAHGGNCIGDGGGGGGGRICIEVTTDNFTGTGTIDVGGGSGFNNGADGTVFYK